MDITKQGITRFDVSIYNGEFKVDIEGVVTLPAVIAIHATDDELVFENALQVVELIDSGDIEAEFGGFIGTTKLMTVKGHCILGSANRNRKIVVWDQMGGLKRTDMFSFTIPDYQTAEPLEKGPSKVDVKLNDYSSNDHAGHDHVQKLTLARVFVNNGHWNYEIKGIVAANAWIGIYDMDVNPGPNNYERYANLAGSESRVKNIHGETIRLYEISAISWFSNWAYSGAVFAIWDAQFDMGSGDQEPVIKKEAFIRFLFQVPVNIVGTIKSKYDNA